MRLKAQTAQPHIDPQVLFGALQIWSPCEENVDQKLIRSDDAWMDGLLRLPGFQQEGGRWGMGGSERGAISQPFIQVIVHQLRGPKTKTTFLWGIWCFRQKSEGIIYVGLHMTRHVWCKVIHILSQLWFKNLYHVFVSICMARECTKCCWGINKLLGRTKSFPAVLSQVQKVKFGYRKFPCTRRKYYLKEINHFFFVKYDLNFGWIHRF